MIYYLIGGLLVLLATIFFKIVYDFKLWKKHIKINHKKEIAIVTPLICIAVFLLGKFLAFSSPINYLISLFFCGSWYLFLFNGGFNLPRHFNWWFIGTPDDNDSDTEKFFRAIGMPTTIALQVLLILISTYLYFIA